MLVSSTEKLNLQLICQNKSFNFILGIKCCDNQIKGQGLQLFYSNSGWMIFPSKEDNSMSNKGLSGSGMGPFQLSYLYMLVWC